VKVKVKEKVEKKRKEEMEVNEDTAKALTSVLLKNL